MKKLGKLKKIIKDMGSCLLAYSGGADSTFLLRISHDVLGNKILAVTASSATYPKEELDFAKRTTKNLGVKHKIINTSELKNNNFVTNPVNRCYFCKKELFSRLKRIAKDNKLNCIVDATNYSDRFDFRPGNKAKDELGVRSPLKESGFTKEEIRSLSKKMGLVTWDKPSLACLASRIPYGVRIEPSILKRINKGEACLRQMGFGQVRLRHYNGLCRIEFLKNDIAKAINMRHKIVDRLRKLGYNYITIDLEGYRSGSLNEVIKK